MKKILLVVMVLVLSLTVCSSAKILPPEEIPILKDNSAEASGLNTLGILKGRGDGLHLDSTLTRAEAVVLILRLFPDTPNSLGLPSPEFADMDGHWAYKEVTAAKKMGLVDGTSSDKFTPDRKVSGKEFAKMLLSLLGYEDVTIENAFDLGEKYEVISNNFTRSVVYDDRTLLRGDAVRLCWSSLIAKAANGKMLYKNLIDAGKYEEDDFYGVLFTLD